MFCYLETREDGYVFCSAKGAHIALHVDDIKAVRKELEEKGIVFGSDEIIENPVCYMAPFTDPDGNDLMLHCGKK